MAIIPDLTTRAKALRPLRQAALIFILAFGLLLANAVPAPASVRVFVTGIGNALPAAFIPSPTETSLAFGARGYQSDQSGKNDEGISPFARFCRTLSLLALGIASGPFIGWLQSRGCSRWYIGGAGVMGIVSITSGIFSMVSR